MSVATGPFVVRNALVTIEGVEYNNQCTKARLVPDVPIQQVRTLVPDGTVSDVDSAIWTLELTILQMNRTGGLTKFLRDSTPGDELDIIIAPKNSSGEDKATLVALALPVPFGDEQGKFALVEVSLPVKGSPTFGSVA